MMTRKAKSALHKLQVASIRYRAGHSTEHQGKVLKNLRHALSVAKREDK